MKSYMPLVRSFCRIGCLTGILVIGAAVTAPGTAFVISEPDIANRLRTALQRLGGDLPLTGACLCTAERRVENSGLARYARIEISERQLSHRCIEALHAMQGSRRNGFEQIRLPFRIVNEDKLQAAPAIV